jgi:hypothetical protein
MTTLASGPASGLPAGQRVAAAHPAATGHVVITRPTARWPFLTSPRTKTMDDAHDGAGRLLIAVAALLLALLAVAMGVVSWHAQFAFVYAIKHQRAAAALEALGLDCGAVIFSALGIALAQLGRRAAIERVLVCVCAAGSCAMNAAGADLASPRSVTAFVMPPVLFAITSDRLVSVIRRSALGAKADSDAQRSAWRIAGLAALYTLRLAAAPASTARGARRALLNATPLPAPAQRDMGREAIDHGRGSGMTGRRGRAARSSSKAAELLRIAADRHDLTTIGLDKVSRVATDIAAEVGLHPATARRTLLAHVRELQGAAS